jgi:hypothetical protein
MENMRFGDLSLLLGVIDSPYCSVTSSLILWAFSYTHFMLTWNVKLLLCSLDLVTYIIIILSCILLLVRLDLFAACGVHRSHYTYFLCGLICSPFCVKCFGYDPCCSVMVFIFGVDVTFSWLISTPVLRWVAVVVHFFFVVDGEWVMLMTVDDYSRSCAFCA